MRTWNERGIIKTIWAFVMKAQMSDITMMLMSDVMSNYRLQIIFNLNFKFCHSILMSTKTTYP